MINRTLSQLGPNLRRFRQGKQMTISELSKKSKLSHSYVTQIERSEKIPTLESLCILLSNLKVNPSTFFLSLDTPNDEQVNTICFSIFNEVIDLDLETQIYILEYVKSFKSYLNGQSQHL